MLVHGILSVTLDCGGIGECPLFSAFRWYYILPHQGAFNVNKNIYEQLGKSNLTAYGNSTNSLALFCDFAVFHKR